jgi:hypothetical protein
MVEKTQPNLDKLPNIIDKANDDFNLNKLNRLFIEQNNDLRKVFESAVKAGKEALPG